MRAAVDDGGPVLIIQDTFTDSDGTAIADHTPDIAPVGSSWSNNRAQKIVGNKSVPSNNLEEWVRINAGVSDVKVSATFTTTLDLIYLTARQEDNFNNQVRAYVEAGTLYIGETIGGTDNVRASAACTVGTTYDITMTVDGTSVSATCNGVTISGTLASDTNITYHGFITDHSTVAVDNFTVEAL
jgi:hypothetical protein